jgi:hypothetical protein
MAIKGPKDNAESKKPRHRSPAYPTVGLREAVARVRKLYEADGKAGAPAELAAVHIGFAKPHGQAMSVLAALKKFGLVSEVNGRWVPTQRAIEILNLPESDERRQRALRDAALSPSIYRQLVKAHQETGWPKNDVLESELVTYRNFNPNSVGDFVKDLKDSLELTGLSDLSALELGDEEDPDVAEVSETPKDKQQQPLTPPAPGGQRKPVQLATQVLAISIPRNLSVDIAVKGDELKREDLAKIKSQFNRWIEGLEEAFEE